MCQIVPTSYCHCKVPAALLSQLVTTVSVSHGRRIQHHDYCSKQALSSSAYSLVTHTHIHRTENCSLYRGNTAEFTTSCHPTYKVSKTVYYSLQKLHGCCFKACKTRFWNLLTESCANFNSICCTRETGWCCRWCQWADRQYVHHKYQPTTPQAPRRTVSAQSAFQGRAAVSGRYRLSASDRVRVARWDVKCT